MQKCAALHRCLSNNSRLYLIRLATLTTYLGEWTFCGLQRLLQGSVKICRCEEFNPKRSHINAVLLCGVFAVGVQSHLQAQNAQSTMKQMYVATSDLGITLAM